MWAGRNERSKSAGVQKGTDAPSSRLLECRLSGRKRDRVADPRTRENKEKNQVLKHIFPLPGMGSLLCLPAFAQKDENNRVENAGGVVLHPDTVGNEGL